MSRIKPIDPKTATGEARRLLDAVQAQLGITPNFVRVLAHSPKALEGCSACTAGVNAIPAKVFTINSLGGFADCCT